MVRGRVTDKATGRPVRATSTTYAFADNPHVGEYPGFPRQLRLQFARIEDDGRYEVVALPGRGLIAVIDSRSTATGPPPAPRRSRDTTPSMQGFNTLLACASPATSYIVAEIDLDPKAESATMDLQVDPGRSVTVEVVDPDGRPLGGTKVNGRQRAVPTGPIPPGVVRASRSTPSTRPGPAGWSSPTRAAS